MVRRLLGRPLLLDAWSNSRLVGSLVAALVAEQKSADHSGALLRFVEAVSQSPRGLGCDVRWWAGRQERARCEGGC
jgi:hypothetical protein